MDMDGDGILSYEDLKKSIIGIYYNFRFFEFARIVKRSRNVLLMFAISFIGILIYWIF